MKSKEKKRIVQQSSIFSWIDGYLFYMGPYLVTRRCVREDEIYPILRTSHDGPCGVNFVDKRRGHKILQLGYYWPTIFKDSREYVWNYDSFQRMGQPL